MAEPQTKPTKQSVAAHIKTLAGPERQKDARTVAAMMRAASGARGTMWGSAIIGFGVRTIPYAGGKTAEWPLIAFASRSSGLVLYLPGGHKPQAALLKGLGKHKLGKGCLYIRQLADVDVPTLKKVVTASVKGFKSGSR
jgi:hypothetical protein